MADLSSILGGMIQGFKDFGTGVVDMFGTGGAAIGDAIESIRTGKATNRNQNDFRKWLYQTDNTQDAAAKGLGTILNGVQTVADVIPGAQAVTANPLFNGLQGAVAGVSDELKMAGKDADWGRAAQRAGVGGASGLLSAAAGQNLQKSGSKLLNNGLTRGAVQGAIGGGIANAGYTGIEGGSVQDMINAGLYGARTGALVGGTTGLARELIKPNHKMDVALTDEEKAARIANIDDQLAKLDTSTQEGIDRHNELMMARIKYEQPQDYMMSHRPTKSGIYADDLLAEGEDGLSYPKDVYDKPQNYTFMYTDTPDVMNETMAQLNAVRGNPNGEVTIYRATPGDTINDGDWITLSESYAKLHNDTQLDGKGNVLSQKVNVRDIQPAMDDLAEWGYFPQKKAPTNVADLMAEKKTPTNVAELMDSNLSEGQRNYFKDSKIRDENGNLMKVYHGSNSDFTVFDSSKGGRSNELAKVGNWFTPSEEGARKFASEAWYGDGGKERVYETYLDIKNPKVYERVNNSDAIGEINVELDKVKAQREAVYNDIMDSGSPRKLYDKNGEYAKLSSKITELENKRQDLIYEDAYEQFKSDVYAMEGKTPHQANVGGLGYGIDNGDETIKKYVDALKAQGYDGIVIKNTGYDRNAFGGLNDQYVAFDSNQIKSTSNLNPTDSPDIMYSKVADGQLGLFDQPMPKPEPEPVTLPKSLGEQASLFDQPKQPIVEAQVVDTEPVNPYAPVDGQVTQKMRDRAADVIKNYAKGVPENELFNAIDESTLPKGYKEFRELVDNSKSFAKERIGAESVKKADLKKVVEYLYPDTAKQEEMLRNVKIEESNDAARRAMYGLKPRKSGTGFNEKILRNAASEKLAKEYAEKMRLVDDRAPELVNSLERWYSPTDLSVRTGLTAAADEVLSERLGIAPGNTIKYNGPADVRNAYGRYSKTAKNLALTKSNVADPEQAVSTMAHERLHSFQNEADLNRGKYGATNRYDKRVTDAFDGLRKDLEEAKVYKSYPETAERYGSKDAEYFYNTKEQEARMLQQYLNNKGYADLAELKRPNTGKSRSGEFGTEVNAAFDKFFDKLRALSKKGVALPALTALFGGGAIAGALTSGKDDKKKKSEVK